MTNLRIPVELIAVIISSLGTYAITKRNTLSKTKREILTYEIDNIFVPLAKFFKCNHEHHEFTIENANKLHILLCNIIADNYKYISVEIFDFESKLHLNLQSNDFNNIKDIYNKIEFYTNNTFDTLKRSLSLPSITLRSKWPLMRTVDKVNFVMNTFILPIFFFSIIAFFIGVITKFVITYIFNNSISADDFPMLTIWCISSTIIIMSFLYSENK